MGRIMLATSNSTDEEYGGEYIASADDMAYDNTSSGLTADNVQEAIDEVDANVDLKKNKSDGYNGLIAYNSSTGGFPIPSGAPIPNYQTTLVVRNQNTGALYVVWYDSAIGAFRIGHTLSGSAPSNGQSAVFSYFK